MSDWLKRVQTSLEKNHCDHRLGKFGDGRLLLTVHAGRILGCALPGVEDNLFWHAPNLENPTAADWAVAGGDRLWVAPEVGFIFYDLKKARRDPITYGKVPQEMDPAQWRIVEDAPGHLRLSTEMNLLDHRGKKKVQVRVVRQFDAVDRPAGLSQRLKSVSFAVRNEITALGGDSGAVAGVWDLLQIPATGWLICPTVTPVQAPTSYFDPFGPKHVKCDKTSVRFFIDGQHRIKMGLSAAQTTGRMGYYRKVGKIATLIFRTFLPLVGEPYVDVRRSSNAFFGGDALQAYNDDGTYGGFGEMEYHDPALVLGKEPSSRIGVSVTHVLAGPDAEIRKAGAALLGVRV